MMHRSTAALSSSARAVRRAAAQTRRLAAIILFV
jgi:hypothetical protein